MDSTCDYFVRKLSRRPIEALHDIARETIFGGKSSEWFRDISNLKVGARQRDKVLPYREAVTWTVSPWPLVTRLKCSGSPITAMPFRRAAVPRQ